MAQVTLRINGYAYTIGCKDGEEKHLEAMGAEVGRRIDIVRASAGPSGESRMLVMAALLMADDIFEMRNKLEVSETPGGGDPKADSKFGRKLDKLTKRAEEVVDGLDTPPEGPRAAG